MEIKEAKQRYGDAIAQIFNKYAAIIGSPTKASTEDGVIVLTKWTKTEDKQNNKDRRI